MRPGIRGFRAVFFCICLTPSSQSASPSALVRHLDVDLIRPTGRVEWPTIPPLLTTDFSDPSTLAHLYILDPPRFMA